MGSLLRENAPLLVACLAVFCVWIPFFASSHVDNGLSDWSYRTDYVGYTLHAILKEHVFPYWVTDPRFEQYRAKGINDFFANPETDVVSLVPPLAALTSVLTAIKLSLAVYLALGVWGCRRVLVVLSGSASVVPLVFVSLLALCNGGFVGHVLAGHVQFTIAATFPLVLALMLESFDVALLPMARAARAFTAGGLLAIAYYAGAAHLLFYALPLFFGFVPVFSILVRPSRARAVLVSAVLGGVAFVALAAFKLWPGLHDFAGYHADYRAVYDGVHAFYSELVTPYYKEGHHYHHETNLYVGWIGVGLLGLSALSVRERRTLALLLATLALASVMFKSPDHLLELPIIRSQGALRRARIVVIPCVALLAGAQLEWVSRWLGAHLRRRTAALLVGLCLSAAAWFAVDLSWTNVIRHELFHSDEPPKTTGPFESAPELVLAPGAHGKVYSRGVGTNWFAYEIWATSAGPLTLHLKTLHASRRMPHLRLVGDGQLVAEGDTVAVRLPENHGRFELVYFDPLSTWGLLCTSLCLAAWTLVTALAWREKRRQHEVVDRALVPVAAREAPLLEGDALAH